MLDCVKCFTKVVDQLSSNRNHCGANSDSPVMVRRQLVTTTDLPRPHLRLFWTGCIAGHVMVTTKFQKTSMDLISFGFDRRCLSGAHLPSRDLLHTVDDLAPFQHLREPAGIAASQASILDIILSSNLSDVEYINPLPSLAAGNRSTLMVHRRRGVLPPPKPHPGPNVWKEKFEQVRSAAALLPWVIQCLTGLEDAQMTIWNGLLRLVSNSIPPRRHKSYAMGSPWFDRGFRSLLKRQNRA